MPLESVQAIVNASVSASGVRLQVGNVDANLFRVSALGVNISDVSNPDAADFRVSAFQGDAASHNVSAKSGDGGTFRVSAIQDGAAALNVSAKSDSASTFRVSSFQGDAASLRVSSVPATQAGAGYSNITGASSVNVLAGKGILESIVFHTSTTARVVLFDSTSHGTNTIATIDGIPTKLTQLNYHAPVSAGITVSAVSAPGDLTVTWRAL